MPQSKPIFIKMLSGCVFIIIMGAALYFKSGKPKPEYEKVSGKIDLLESTFENYRTRDHRYIRVEGYDRVFDIFIGKETGDFSPEFENLDNLHVGDNISVYHSDGGLIQRGKDELLNRNVEFIDKGIEPYYIRGTKNKLGGIAFFTLGVLMIIGLFALKRKGKIN